MRTGSPDGKSLLGVLQEAHLLQQQSKGRGRRGDWKTLPCFGKALSQKRKVPVVSKMTLILLFALAWLNKKAENCRFPGKTKIEMYPLMSILQYDANIV